MDRDRSESPKRHVNGSNSLKRGLHFDGEHTERDPHLGNGQKYTQQERRVYVGNLSYQVRWFELKEFMGQVGNVLNCEILNLPNGLSKGCAIIEYSTAEEARTAIKTLSNQKFMGRLVYIREDREQNARFGSSSVSPSASSNGKDSEPDRQLFVGNLPYNVRWQDLKDLFRQAGSVIRADIQMNQEGRSRGIGIVVMSSMKEAMHAIQMLHNTDFMGRTLEVRLDRFAHHKSKPYSTHGNGYTFPAEMQMTTSSTYLPMLGANTQVEDLVYHAYPHGPCSDCIYVGNLPWATSDRNLLDLFTDIGSVIRARIAYEPTGRSKGFGVVQFENENDAASSIEKLNGYRYGGRPLQLSYAHYATPLPAVPTVLSGLPSVAYTPPVMHIPTTNSPLTPQSFTNSFLGYLPISMPVANMPAIAPISVALPENNIEHSLEPS